MHPTDTHKSKLRKKLLATRAELEPAERAHKSLRILSALRSTPQWASAREVLLYMPIKNEVDVRPVLDELWGRGVRLLLPRCRPKEPGQMDIACVTASQELVPGMYGIQEPCPARCPTLEKCAPDVILVPGVGFDLTGARLGFGAGFYDRFLAGNCASNAIRFGLAYEFQLVERFEADPWDVPMHAIITEDRIIWT